jgi:hypothetical protein
LHLLPQSEEWSGAQPEVAKYGHGSQMSAQSTAWGWVSGLIVGGGAYLALLALPSDYITQTRLLTTLFLLGLLQGTRSRFVWLWAVPLGTIGTVATFVLVARLDAESPLKWPLRLLAYVAIINTPGFMAALIGLLARIVGERVSAQTKRRQAHGFHL